MTRRADRHFAIIEALRGVPVLRAEDLAARLTVSVRTVYRDIARLIAAGTPIEGEAGIGYRLRNGADVRPLLFNADELEALMAGLQLVRTSTNVDHLNSVSTALAKINAVIPPMPPIPPSTSIRANE